METFQTTLENFRSKLWQYHCPVPSATAENLIDGNNKRVICHIKEKSFHAALMKSNAYWFILINKTLKDQLALQEGESLEMGLEKDNAEFGHEMPEELQVLLDQDEEGHR